MPNKFGPTKSDLIFRLAVSLAGLALVVGALLFRGTPETIGGWEAIVMGSAFFGGTLIWTLIKFARKDYPDAKPGPGELEG